MARPPRGQEILEKAQKLLAKATKADELRTLQAVVFPLANGMSTQETARAIGRSPRWVTSARNEFIRSAGVLKKGSKKVRNRAYMTRDEEQAFLAPFFETARCGGMLVVSVIHTALEQHLGRKVALASAYNLLHRHGWRKLAPDKRNMAADIQAQDEWKKTSRPPCANRRRMGQARPHKADVPRRGAVWSYCTK
jgi:transposase